MVKLYEGGVYLRGGKELVRESDAAAAGIAATPEVEIGRASCRERV